MELRGWGEMETDCLTNIFGRLGIDDLAVAVPFVCQWWYRASLIPLCWTVLDFQPLDFMPWSRLTRSFMERYSPPQFSFSVFMRFVIRRSSKAAVELKFSFNFPPSLEDLVLASNEGHKPSRCEVVMEIPSAQIFDFRRCCRCPRLKFLALPNLRLEDEVSFPDLVGKWKDLERLDMGSKPSLFTEMAAQNKCTKLRALKMNGAIKEDDALSIVRFFPNLRYLDLNKSNLPKKSLLTIMNGCTELERLSARDCIGFEADDEVLKKAARIKIFEHEGSELINHSWYETDDENVVLTII